MLFSNPVRGVIHPQSWQRPRGNDEFRLTQDFGPSGLSVEPSVIWPGGEGIPAGFYPNFHRGIDLGNQDCGAAVIAARAGRVDFAGIDGTGNRVVILDHGSGFRTWYGHLKDRTVAEGQSVRVGTTIGHVGSAAATACHLHFAVEVNHGNGGNFEWVDPWRRLMQNVTVHPKADDGIRIRNAATTFGNPFAQTRGGRIVRGDGKDLGSVATPRDWNGTVTGGSYVVDGQKDNQWERIALDGEWRFIASPLAVLSQR